MAYLFSVKDSKTLKELLCNKRSLQLGFGSIIFEVLPQITIRKILHCEVKELFRWVLVPAVKSNE